MSSAPGKVPYRRELPLPPRWRAGGARMLSFCVRRKAGERVDLLSLSELRRYAWEYRRQSTPGARREIIRIVWRHEKAEGLQLLARMLGVTYDSLYSEGDIKEFKRQRCRFSN
ncbi:hypothetical protein J2Z49_002924 [Desulfofundulus luciae]|uniref:Uncharacterized protein n=1 Tax=Desulfofundulus luciae TaxID=74702 RepID=A0ABU0B4Z3_9FIRM|nr:hypothetical protein [Desulfofundulus luciae]MDQ0287791.1 hypothetical protein [Desulfofundulus luciae]